jgi:GAF domain-containing protein
VLGVFDIDSPTVNRFSEEDRQGLETLVATFLTATDFN